MPATLHSEYYQYRQISHKTLLQVSACAHGHMWVSCRCVQKSRSSNVPHSLFFFMCVPCVPATFLQIFIPGVKRSWSLSPVYSPVLSLTLTFFHADWEWQQGRGRSQGSAGSGGGGHMGVTGGQQREPLVKGAGQRPEERSAEERAFTVMNGVTSSRNQKPTLPRHLLAKAHSAAMQGVNCTVIWHLLTSKNMLRTGRERGVVMIPAWFLNEPHVSEKRRKTRVQLQDEVPHLWSLSSAQQLDQWGLCNYIWWCAAQINELCAGWPIGFAQDSLDLNFFTCSLV